MKPIGANFVPQPQWLLILDSKVLRAILISKREDTILRKAAKDQQALIVELLYVAIHEQMSLIMPKWDIPSDFKNDQWDFLMADYPIRVELDCTRGQLSEMMKEHMLPGSHKWHFQGAYFLLAPNGLTGSTAYFKLDDTSAASYFKLRFSKIK